MFDHDAKARKRIEELDEAITTLRRDFHKLEMDWADTLDKVKRMMMRIAKRAEVAERAEAEEAEPSAEGGPQLSGRMRQINDAILRRRNRAGGT